MRRVRKTGELTCESETDVMASGENCIICRPIKQKNNCKQHFIMVADATTRFIVIVVAAVETTSRHVEKTSRHVETTSTINE